jgi:hypothetical protein
VYVWIWRHLPGGLPGRLLGSLILLSGALALLFFLVFPYAEPRLPFNNVTVDPNGTPSSSASPTPSP